MIPAHSLPLLRRCAFSRLASFLLAALAFGAGARATAPQQPAARTSLAWRIDYGPDGDVRSVTDPANRKTTWRTTRYPGGGIRTSTELRPDGSRVVREFDRAGRCTKLVDGAGSVVYEYDRRGRLAAARRAGSPTLELGYDYRNRPKSLRIGAGFRVRYDYDYRGRLVRVTTPVGAITYQWRADGTVIRRLPNGITSTTRVRPDGRIAAVSHTAPGNQALAQYRYDYRLDGLIATVNERVGATERSLQYGYDADQRLVSLQGRGVAGVTYGYDGLGNRTSHGPAGGPATAATYDWAGRLTSFAGAACRHDAVGSLARVGGRSAAFEFHDTGRLAAWRDGARAVRYVYDGDGNLVVRSQGADRRVFLPDPRAECWQPLHERHGQDDTFYVWDGESPLLAVRGKEVSFFLSDQLGTVRVVVDRRGKVVERRDYTPFGGPARPLGGGALEPGFAGLLYDRDAELYLTPARAYDPTLGRFLQRDPEQRLPLGSQEDLSQYAYCGNDPVNYVDRSGGARRPIGLGVMHWGSMLSSMRDLQLSSDIMRQQQQIRARQSRMAADLHARQQTLRARQGRMAASIQQQRQQMLANQRNMTMQMQQRQQRMMARNQRMSQDIMRRQQDLRLRQSRMQSEIMQNQFRMRERAAAGLRPSRDLALSYARLSQGIVRTWSKSLVVSYYNVTGNLAQASGLPGMGFWGGVGKAISSRINATQPLSVQAYANVSARTYDTMTDLIGAARDVRAVSRNITVTSQTSLDAAYHRPRSGETGLLTVNPTSLTEIRGIDRTLTYGTPRVTDHYSWRLNLSGVKQFVADKVWGRFDGFASRTGQNLTADLVMRGFSNETPGGVRLAGASRHLGDLGDLGHIDGIALDVTNGRLVLIGAGRTKNQELPALRLDDVVTVFRCVYLHGEAPNVTIDPISAKKGEKWMKVGHGKGTSNTYVGWILYETDRVMKCYGLGRDNRTNRPMRPAIAGYRDFNAIGMRGARGGGQRWERFWIVPASQTRRRADGLAASMFEVPLELKTERMEWNGKQLVTAKDPTPSPSATAYSAWFTRQYDKIAAQARLRPPRAFGIDRKVLIFEELRRIALITAIAEALRNQNVPFPHWMYDYPVRRAELDERTEMIRVTKPGVYEVSGGVRLAVASDRITTHDNDAVVTGLSKEIRSKLEQKPLFAAVPIQYQGKSRRAVTLPGADTRESGPNVLTRVDLSADFLTQAGIPLARRFHSFFDPRGDFGRGWTLDLPRLRRLKQPVSRTARTVRTKDVYELTSPHGTWSDRFAVQGAVPELGRQMLLPARSHDVLGLADANVAALRQPTKQLFLRGGGSFHFDAAGYLVGYEHAGAVLRYERNRDQRLVAIRAMPKRGAAVPRAEVRFERNDNGLVKLVEARVAGSDAMIRAYYIYDEGGQLATVVGKDFAFDYSYRNGLVTSVRRDEQLIATFQYNAKGQIVRQGGGEASDVAFRRSVTSTGSKVAATDPKTGDLIEEAEYDQDLGLRAHRLADGTQLSWRERGDAIETSYAAANGDVTTITDSTDGRRRTVRSNTGVETSNDYDDQGRLVRRSVDGKPELEQSWSRDGRLRVAISPDSGIRNAYTRDGRLAQIELAPPEQVRSGKVTRFVRSQLDREGRVRSVVDDEGNSIDIEYDRFDQPAVVRTQRAKVEVDRGAQGRLQRVRTSWGRSESYAYERKSGRLRQVTLRQRNGGREEAAHLDIEAGRLQRIRHPGGAVRFTYREAADQLASVNTSSGLRLGYRYRAGSQLAGVDVGASGKSAYRIDYAYDGRGRLIGVSYRPAAGR